MGKKIYKLKFNRENIIKSSGVLLGGLIIILIFISYIFVEEFTSLTEYTNATQHTYVVLQQIENSLSLLKDAETSIRGFVITKDTAFLRPMHDAETNLPATMDSLQTLLSTNPEEMEIFRKLSRLEIEKMALVKKSEQFSMFQTVQKDSLYVEMLYEKRVMDQYRYFATQAIENETADRQQHQAKAIYYKAHVTRNFQIFFFIISIFTISLMLWLSLELRRRVVYENKLKEKLTELNISNSELEQIAFAASHDLQEPLRKIRIFTDRLLIISKDTMNGESLMLTERIGIFAKRLQELIMDLVQFNELVQQRKKADYFSLEKVVAEVQKNFAISFENHQVETNVSELPQVFASREETEIIFMQLFANSIQFAAEERVLKIKISSTEIDGESIENLPEHLKEKEFYKISFNDNGIGFDNAFKSKLFQPFQRLHNFYDPNEGRRKGMGLAMCKRVMLNAGGWIDADSEENVGTTILLYYPVENKI